MDYLTVWEAAEKWGVTSRMATYYCEKGRIPDALKKGNLWLIPKDASKQPTEENARRNDF